MNKNIIYILLLFSSFNLFAQKNKVLPYDFSTFHKNKELGYQLYLYDYVAWGTTDTIVKHYNYEMALLGREWFAIEDSINNKWYAVYGKLDSSGYTAQIIFEKDMQSGIVERIKESPYTSEYLQYAKALNTADTEVFKIVDQTPITFNSYILRNADQTFSVYYLPAIYNNNIAVYGAEHIFLIDSTGQKILKDESYLGEELRGYEIGKDPEINLNYEDCTTPTIGSIFYIYSFNHYYDKIFIILKDYATILIKDSNTWVNFQLKESKKSKKKKK